jgi:putative spermidine/putrescine transport system substrate-binding protein
MRVASFAISKVLIVPVIFVFTSFAWLHQARAETVLTVTDYGGSFEEGWKKAVVEPFEKKYPDIKIKILQKLAFESVAMMRAQKDDVKVDVFMTEEVAVAQADAEGLVQPLSTTTVPNLVDLYPQFRASGDTPTSAKFMYVALVLAYNTEKIKSPPQSWRDFWDPRYKGKIAIWNIDSNTGLNFFLVLIRTTGATLDNVNPVFDAMKELKPSVVTFSSQHAQVAQLFTQGDIVMAPWTSDRVMGLAGKGLPVAWVIPKEGSNSLESVLAIAKGTKNLDAALKYVNFALSVQAQADNAKYTFISPTNSKVVLDPDIAKKIPNQRSEVEKLTHPDWPKVNRLRPQWIDRWNREITP